MFLGGEGFYNQGGEFGSRYMYYVMQGWIKICPAVAWKLFIYEDGATL